MCGTEEFMKLPPLLLLQVIADDCLVFNKNGFLINSSEQEKDILFAVLQYFEHNQESVHYLTKFLSEGIRLPLVPRDVLKSLQNSPLIASSSANKEVVKKAKKWSAKSKPASWAAHRVLTGLFAHYMLVFCCLWPPCIADADIIFLPCGFFLSFFYSSPNLSSRRLDVYHTLTHDVALGLERI